jgi:hypothetical protein
MKHVGAFEDFGFSDWEADILCRTRFSKKPHKLHNPKDLISHWEKYGGRQAFINNKDIGFVLLNKIEKLLRENGMQSARQT